LYERLAAQVQRKGHVTETGTAIGKFARMNDMLAENVGQRAQRFSNALDVVDVAYGKLSQDFSQGGGFLAHAVVDNILDIAPTVTRKLQTISHFGFLQGELSGLAHVISGRGGYRIVPVGQALQFETVWDGISLISHLTRVINLEI
jgi:hypothetical protein